MQEGCYQTSVDIPFADIVMYLANQQKAPVKGLSFLRGVYKLL